MTDEWNAHTDGAVVPGGAGWGVLMQGRPERRFAGTLNTGDVMVAELWAVKMAVRHTPSGAALVVHTDSQSLPALLDRHGTGAAWKRRDLHDLTLNITQRAAQRAIALSCRWASRDEPAQQIAHALAVSGRQRGAGPEGWSVELADNILQVWRATRRARSGWVVRLDGTDAAASAARDVLTSLPDTGVPLTVVRPTAEAEATLHHLALTAGRQLLRQK